MGFPPPVDIKQALAKDLVTSGIGGSEPRFEVVSSIPVDEEHLFLNSLNGSSSAPSYKLERSVRDLSLSRPSGVDVLRMRSCCSSIYVTVEGHSVMRESEDANQANHPLVFGDVLHGQSTSSPSVSALCSLVPEPLPP